MEMLKLYYVETVGSRGEQRKQNDPCGSSVRRKVVCNTVGQEDQ